MCLGVCKRKEGRTYCVWYWPVGLRDQTAVYIKCLAPAAARIVLPGRQHRRVWNENNK